MFGSRFKNTKKKKKHHCVSIWYFALIWVVNSVSIISHLTPPPPSCLPQEEMTSALATMRVDYDQVKIKDLDTSSNPLLNKRRKKAAAGAKSGSTVCQSQWAEEDLAELHPRWRWAPVDMKEEFIFRIWSDLEGLLWTSETPHIKRNTGSKSALFVFSSK